MDQHKVSIVRMSDILGSRKSKEKIACERDLTNFSQCVTKSSATVTQHTSGTTNKVCCECSFKLVFAATRSRNLAASMEASFSTLNP